MKYNTDLRQQLKQRLTGFPVQKLQAEKSAAVALIVVEQGFGADLANMPAFSDWQTSAAVILTRRSSKLSKHAGQWALPGGRVDLGETVHQAAIRETQEEINLDLNSHHYLGQLDDYVTRSGYAMSPLIFWAENLREINPNPDEVESVHRIPCTEFLREDAPILDYHELEDTERLTTDNNPVLRMPLGSHWIAAPTAAILYQFREVCLLDRQTRVAHFEQPKFAWR